MARFWILVVCQILSVLCYILVFFCLLKSRELNKQHLHNHAIVAILIVYFFLIVIELPITLSFAYRGYVWPQSFSFCSFWIGCNYSLFTIGSQLMAFASIERYFLIFHEHFIRSWRHFIHYPPIVVCIIGPIIFYTLMIGLAPCETIYNYETYLCGHACYQLEFIEGSTDWILNAGLPAVLIAIANAVLIIRVNYRKQLMQLTNQWRKNRLMYIQLLSISLIYCFIWIPFMIISLIQIFVNPSFCADVTLLLLNYTLYISPLVLPFLSLIGLPTVRRQVMVIIYFALHGNRRRQNQVRPFKNNQVPKDEHEMTERQQGGHVRVQNTL
jgi:hypothetical protein